MGGGCPSNSHSFYVNNYCPKYYELKKAINEVNSQLISGNSGDGYAQKHDMYNGLQAHLVELQKERAALSENGQGIKSIWKPEDSMIAWLFGITEEKAS